MQDELPILGMKETIVGRFIGGDMSKNVRKSHLQYIMNVKRKKCNEHYELICFMEEDFEVID